MRRFLTTDCLSEWLLSIWDAVWNTFVWNIIIIWTTVISQDIWWSQISMNPSPPYINSIKNITSPVKSNRSELKSAENDEFRGVRIYICNFGSSSVVCCVVSLIYSGNIWAISLKLKNNKVTDILNLWTYISDCPSRQDHGNWVNQFKDFLAKYLSSCDIWCNVVNVNVHPYIVHSTEE